MPSRDIAARLGSAYRHGIQAKRLLYDWDEQDSTKTGQPQYSPMVVILKRSVNRPISWGSGESCLWPCLPIASEAKLSRLTPLYLLASTYRKTGAARVRLHLEEHFTPSDCYMSLKKSMSHCSV